MYSLVSRLPAPTPRPRSFRLISTSARDALCDKLGVSTDRVLVTIPEVRSMRKQLHLANQRLGFVPTMGALHEGHLSLLRESVGNNPKTISSVFVNAGQFAPHEDLDKYPRGLERDLTLLFEQGCDYAFVPTQEEMYPGSTPGQTGPQLQTLQVVPSGIDGRAEQEGGSRPGFFQGVATVVAKLFNIVQPDAAYFGQKDGLQCIVIRQMIRDLNFPIDFVACPTVRESDGLAMSSRNAYLSPEQRAVAPKLYQALCAAESAFRGGCRSYDDIRSIAELVLEQEELFTIEYISICDIFTAEEMNHVDNLPEDQMMISMAVNFGNCRILDNILIGGESRA